MITRIRTWATMRRRSREEGIISELRESLDFLELNQPIPVTLEEALRKSARSDWIAIPLSTLSVLALWLWGGWVFALTWSLGRGLVSFGNGISPPSWGGIVKAVERVEPMRVGLALPIFGFTLAISAGAIAFMVVCGFVLAQKIGGTATVNLSMLQQEGNSLPFSTAVAAWHMTQIVNSCAKADQATGEERVHKIVGIPGSSGVAKRAILRASRHRALSRPFSHHSAALRAHAALVLGRIDQAEEGLYRDPSPALRELAALWLTIAERYVDGRVGQLLSEDLSSVKPAKSRLQSALRAALAVVLTVGAVFFTASLDLPQAIEGYVIAGSAVAVLLLVYGARAIVELRRR
ncbi:hypothetical protein ACWGNY_10485 [[Kitasatospora] papulosa]|uniref:hypothetical protein n=1 Tax=[Kitasatospora] papulosa TaxID=1464011 RepID=UPI0036410D5B